MPGSHSPPPGGQVEKVSGLNIETTKTFSISIGG